MNCSALHISIPYPVKAGRVRAEVITTETQNHLWAQNPSPLSDSLTCQSHSFM